MGGHTQEQASRCKRQQCVQVDHMRSKSWFDYSMCWRSCPLVVVVGVDCVGCVLTIDDCARSRLGASRHPFPLQATLYLVHVLSS